MSPLGSTHDARTRRLMALLAEHHADVLEHRARYRRAQELDIPDQSISRCPACLDWRWHATHRPCQGCGAHPSIAHLTQVEVAA